MINVRIEVLPSLAEAVGMEETREEVIADEEFGGDYSVRHLLNRLSLAYHRIDRLVFDVATQQLTGQVMIFVNGRPVELANGLDTRLTNGDTVTFIPFTEGG